MISHPEADTFVLNNGLISRTLCVNGNGLHTSAFVNLKSGTDYVFATGSEFVFSFNNENFPSFCATTTRDLDGATEINSFKFEFKGYDIKENSDLSKELVLHFERASVMALDAVYRIYPDVAGIRKHLEITNISDSDAVLQKVHFDNMLFAPENPGDCNLYLDFDRRMPPNFAIDTYEDTMRIHSPKLNEGLFYGTNTPGPLRNLLFYPQWGKCGFSYNMGGAFLRKTLAPQETFVTHDALITLYCGNFEDQACADGYRKLIRKNLPSIPTEGVMYCTWIPFLLNISDELVCTLADNAKEMGFDYLVVDDGWFKVKSDWQVDEKKFPEGLEKVADKVHRCGLKFGLWFNIGTDYGMKEVNPAYAARCSDGSMKPFGDTDRKVMCFGTEWRFFITEQLISLAEKYKVDYFKLDFSTICSPYCTQEWGCHSTEHKFHKNYNDSMTAMYDGMMYLRNELKKRFPDLLVDFSFENFGTARPNIAALEYSEIHHVSNLSANKTDCQQIDKIRNAFYNWLKVMPPERVLNGLLSIKGERALEYFLTSLAGAPLVAGDLSKLDADPIERIKKCCAAFKRSVEKGALTTFEVVCDSNTRDGFIRRADDGRAILCLFNRTDEVWTLDMPGFSNAENGSPEISVKPHDCAMFTCGV